MKGEHRLTRPEQFTLVYDTGSSVADRYLVFKAVANGLESSRYGISVSKRVGNAVVRNRVKRVLREVLRLTSLPAGWDLIAIARGPAAGSDFHQLEKSTHSLLTRLKILK